MKFIKLISTSGVEYFINKKQITFIQLNDEKHTVLVLSCSTVLEVKETIDFILNA